MKVKFKVSQQRLWVAKKRGMPTGYGDTPDAAIKDSMKSKEKTEETFAWYKDQANLGEAARARIIAQANLDKARLLKTIDEQYKDLALCREHAPLDSWLMMACAYLGTTDPHAALAEMYKRGVSHGSGEHESADRVAKLMTRWLAWGDKK